MAEHFAHHVPVTSTGSGVTVHLLALSDNELFVIAEGLRQVAETREFPEGHHVHGVIQAALEGLPSGFMSKSRR